MHVTAHLGLSNPVISPVSINPDASGQAMPHLGACSNSRHQPLRGGKGEVMSSHQLFSASRFWLPPALSLLLSIVYTPQPSPETPPRAAAAVLSSPLPGQYACSPQHSRIHAHSQRTSLGEAGGEGVIWSGRRSLP